MPVIIPKDLPATKVLRDNNIFVMNDLRAHTQDIRALKICILNLMPDKISTETQLLRMLSNSIIHTEITLLAMKTHQPKNTSTDHLDIFYKYYDDIKDQHFDGLIITGAPIEHLEFEQVKYWPELKEIFEWSKTNVFTSMFICWASQAAYHHFYDINKEDFDEKLFGVYSHYKVEKNDKLFTGLNDNFYVPQSRNTQSDQSAIENCLELDVLAKSNEAGIHIVANKDRTQLFISGHSEYDRDTLLKEFLRDKEKNKSIKIPVNYFVNNDENNEIDAKWMSDGSLIFMNWLNYYVYQLTPFELD